jgi:hypothetical protein
MKIDKLRSSQAIALRANKRGRHVLKCWRSFLQYSMHMRIYKKLAFRHYLHKLSVKVRKLLKLSQPILVKFFIYPFGIAGLSYTLD